MLATLDPNQTVPAEAPPEPPPPNDIGRMLRTLALIGVVLVVAMAAVIVGARQEADHQQAQRIAYATTTGWAAPGISIKTVINKHLAAGQIELDITLPATRSGKGYVQHEYTLEGPVLGRLVRVAGSSNNVSVTGDLTLSAPLDAFAIGDVTAWLPAGDAVLILTVGGVSTRYAVHAATAQQQFDALTGGAA